MRSMPRVRSSKRGALCKRRRTGLKTQTWFRERSKSPEPRWCWPSANSNAEACRPSCLRRNGVSPPHGSALMRSDASSKR